MSFLSWFLAWRYLKRHPRRKHIAFSTVVSIAGIALGVGALIIVMGILTGLEDFITESIIKVDSPLTVLPGDGNVLNIPDSIVEQIEAHPLVRTITPFISGEAIVRLPSRNIDYGCKIMGIASDSDFLDNVIESSRYYDLEELTTGDGTDGIIMGIYLMDHFYHAKGDTVYIFPPSAFFSSRGGAIGKAVILGAVETGLPVNDENLAWIPIELAQRIYFPSGGYSGFNIHPTAGTNIDQVITELEIILPATVVVSPWQ
ncbi:MAG: ABC transporter permease, partial [FCB group bacterium]|nr:ABC transporter permease [FCB group bacterium]